MTRRLLLACLASLCIPASTGAQTSGSLRFVSPTATTYLTGPVVMRVTADGLPAGDALQEVTFFADGQQVCVVPGSRPECSWDSGPRLTQHALRAVARLSSGGRLVANVRTMSAEFVEKAAVDVLLANAVVSDGGKFITGLQRDAFRVFDDGQERPITSFQSTDASLDVVLALDVSDSMRDVLPEVKIAATSFVRSLRKQDRVTLVVFNDAMYVPVRGADTPDEVTAAIAKLTAFGSTALFDVAVRSLDLLSQQSGKHALVFFTDGDDRSSQAALDQVQRAVSASDAMVFAIGLGPRNRREALRDRLELLTGASGGRVLVADNGEDLKDSFTDVVRDLVNQYTLGFEPRRDGRTHAIRVELIGHSGRIRARRSYNLPPR
jgi:Ca-activated chloride channel homolog